MRVDVMTKMRGVDPFDKLWSRRTVLEIAGTEIDVLGIGDLVRAKKTQRDKDWPMIARLLEADYAAHKSLNPDKDRLEFWLHELRTTLPLMELAAQHPELAAEVAANRPAVIAALSDGETAIRKALRDEEEAEREADRLYWEPLKRELERLRHDERRAQ
jgi:hypothetical protein